MFDFLKNTFLNRGRYKTHSEAVIVSCFYNPQNSPYRLLAFQKWYRSIRHLNHRVIECLIGPDAKKQLPDSPYISTIQTESLLWHKESLLNKVFSELPDDYRYIFWVDADVLFSNDRWLLDGVEALQTANIIQPFEYCIHMERNQLRPDFDVDAYRATVNDPARRHKSMWRSFCANHLDGLSSDLNYDRHGHVGFAWAARREVLDKVPLYDKALIGGSDHILAHAAACQVPHPCISKSFTDNLEEVLAWSRAFCAACDGQVGYVPGDLYHIWHGDIANRQYLQRIKDFTEETKTLTERDKNGLYVKRDKNEYMKRYYRQREATQIYEEDFAGFDEGFMEDMGYAIWDIINLFGRPTYYDPGYDQEVIPPEEVRPELNMGRFADTPIQGEAPSIKEEMGAMASAEVPSDVSKSEMGAPAEAPAPAEVFTSSNFS